MNLDRLLFWKDVKWENVNVSDNLLTSLLEDYVKDTGRQPCCTDGPGSLKEYLIEHQNYYIRNHSSLIKKTMNSKEYALKPNKVLYIKSWHRYLATESITDAEAEKLLNENPNYSTSFAKMPDEMRAKVNAALGIETPAAVANENSGEEEITTDATASTEATDLDGEELGEASEDADPLGDPAGENTDDADPLGGDVADGKSGGRRRATSSRSRNTRKK
jgi:hypothetical protein